MSFVLAIAEDHVPSTQEPDPYMHVSLDAGAATCWLSSSCLRRRRWDAIRTPDWVQHIAFKVKEGRIAFEFRLATPVVSCRRNGILN